MVTTTVTTNNNEFDDGDGVAGNVDGRSCNGGHNRDDYDGRKSYTIPRRLQLEQYIRFD